MLGDEWLQGGIAEARCNWLLESFLCVCACVHVPSAHVHFGVFRVTDSQAACVGPWIIW